MAEKAGEAALPAVAATKKAEVAANCARRLQRQRWLPSPLRLLAATKRGHEPEAEPSPLRSRCSACRTPGRISRLMSRRSEIPGSFPLFFDSFLLGLIARRIGTASSHPPHATARAGWLPACASRAVEWA
ncbi:hypothetical protein [Variovorax paradoxus]|uniref:hypothetical protein n=1 Tax=Variovorax paradoxus TaxID=34073 RepID=UPI0012D3B26F|nr:hypothetical protein [Variovorax paradoxus]